MRMVDYEKNSAYKWLFGIDFWATLDGFWGVVITR